MAEASLVNGLVNNANVIFQEAIHSVFPLLLKRRVELFSNNGGSITTEGWPRRLLHSLLPLVVHARFMSLSVHASNLDLCLLQLE